MPEERISVEDKNYILGPYLASGLIGTVFPAWEDYNYDLQKRPIKAVKVPAPNLTKDLLGKFWLEFETLKKLNKKWVELYPGVNSPFPIAEKGRKEDNTEALVMDYLPDDIIVSRVFSLIKNPFERETQYLKAAQQYVQMLEVLRQAGYTCPDRKTPDVRWRENRLVVLDWNVVTESKSEEDIKQDYYLFGSMWHQFLTGKYASIDLDVLSDDYWGDLSVETRVLLKKLLQGQYANDTEIETDINKFMEWRGKDASLLALDARQSLADIQALEGKVQASVKNKQAEGGGGKFGDLDLDTLIQIDLAWRLNPELYQKEREKFIKFVQDRSKRFTYYAQIALLRGNYQEGLDTANRLHDEMQAQDAVSRLLLERWRILLQAAVSQSDFRGTGKVYSDWLSHQDDEDKFWQEFPETQEIVPPLLEIFTHERKIRRAWSDFHASQANGKYAQAKQALGNIRSLLVKIESLSIDYARILEQAVLIDLEKHEKKIAEKAEAESAFDVSQKIGELNKSLWMAHLRNRINDSGRYDEWRKEMQSVLDDLNNLGCLLANVKDNNDVSQTISVIIKLCRTDIWVALEQNQLMFLNWLEKIPFPAAKNGFLKRMEVIRKLSRPDEIPARLRCSIEKIQSAYICDAFDDLQKMADAGGLNRNDYDEMLEAYNSCGFKFQKG